MYPYKRGDRVMIGIATKDQSERWTRYFKAATVEANDREAGALATKSDIPHSGGHGYETYLFEDFNGDEIVPYDESYPTTPEAAHLMMDDGTHPDLHFQMKRWDEINVGDRIFLDGAETPLVVKDVKPSLFEPWLNALHLSDGTTIRGRNYHRVKVLSS